MSKNICYNCDEEENCETDQIERNEMIYCSKSKLPLAIDFKKEEQEYQEAKQEMQDNECREEDSDKRQQREDLKRLKRNQFKKGRNVYE